MNKKDCIVLAGIFIVGGLVISGIILLSNGILGNPFL
jgi:hypothetical protein